MDCRRAAGALLALAACVAITAAAPTASDQTSLNLYEGAEEGCYYNFQHYGEGDRIMTNEPCLNCTCHNRMLMCYLRVCPFTKPIGQDCTVEKRADQCCPIVTCPDVPVDLLTSTSTSSPMEYGATGLGKLDMYGCSINGRYFPEGSKVPSTPNKPCEHCYCIRNMTTCVMQECTLHVDGCTPIYHKDVCCPVRYSCDHPEDEIPLLDDMTTTVRPTQGFLLTTTTLSPVTQMTQDCVHEDKIFPDGALIKTEKACEHCYCMKGDIVCVVQECGTPMENEGKNCTSLAPREGQCCPDTYICEGDDLSTGITEIPTNVPTDVIREDVTALPPKVSGGEGSGYTAEPEELYTGMPSVDSGIEGSGEEDLDKSLSSSAAPQLFDEIFETSKDTFDQHAITGRPQSHEITTESDNTYNTIPSDISGDKVTGTSTTKTIISAEGSKVTETSSTGKPTYIEESVTNIPDLTTEKSFRKDDHGEVTKESESFTQKELDELATVAADVINVPESTPGYEYLPSSEETDTKSTSTLSPTHIINEEATTESKLPLTELEEKPVKEPVPLNENETTVTNHENDIQTESSVINKEESSTAVYPDRIPGEGDCLYNGVTYRNESNVPSSNKCDLSCKCVSSIVRCDPIICSPAPEFMDNCQAEYDSPESCCPTYICQSKETIPPQSHSQMSGTDSPLIKPVTECSTGDCLVANDKEQHEKLDTPKNAMDCDSDKNCIKTSIPEVVKCEGESCTKLKSDCHSTQCDTAESNQKHEDQVKEECLDESCRRKETGSLEKKPSLGCENSECLQEIPVITTIKPDISTVSPSLTEPVTELSSDKYSTEADLGHNILDSSVKEKEQSTEIKPFQTTETSEFVQTTLEPITYITTEEIAEENPLASYTTKASMVYQSFGTSETPETITVKTSSEAENNLVPSETTPTDDLVSYVTLTPETITPNEPVTQIDAFDSIESDTQKPDFAEKEKGDTKKIDDSVTQSQPIIPSTQDFSSESSPRNVTHYEHTELPQEEPKVVPEEYVTKITTKEEPEMFTSIPDYQTDRSAGSKTPEISTEIPKSVTNYEENRDLTTSIPEQTTYVIDHVSTEEKEWLQTELPESSTYIIGIDETVTKVPEQATTHRSSTELSEKLLHGEEENEIPTKTPDHKITTDGYSTPIPGSEIKQTTKYVDLSTTTTEKEYLTELPEIIKTTSKSSIIENEVYTESPKTVSPVEIGTEPENEHMVTKPPHHKEEENEIPTETPEDKITVDDQKLPPANEDIEEKTELPEIMTTIATDDLTETKQHIDQPEYPIHSEGEHNKETLEHTTHEPVSEETVGYELPSQPMQSEFHTEIPQSSVPDSQNDFTEKQIEILSTEIPEVNKLREQEVPEISTQKQSLIPENTMLPEIMGTIDSLAITEPTSTDFYDVTSKIDEEPVTKVYEPSTSSSEPELSVTTLKTGVTSMEILQSVSDHTLPQSSQGLSTNTPEYSYKTTMQEIVSEREPVTGMPENQVTKSGASDTLKSQVVHTTPLPAIDVTGLIETETDTEKLVAELVTMKAEEPEYITENVQTEAPLSSTLRDNDIIDHKVAEQEIQTEHSIPIETEIPEHLDMVTEHKEFTEVPEIILETTELIPTKITETKNSNEPEYIPTEQQQIVTSNPEETNEMHDKDLAAENKDVITTENTPFVVSDQTKQFDIGTELPITNDLISTLHEEEHEPSRKNEHNPDTESSSEFIKITITEVPEIQMSITPTYQVASTSSTTNDTKSFISTESDLLGSPAVSSGYEEMAATDKYDSGTKLHQQMEEGVTYAPHNISDEQEIRDHEMTPEIDELTTESQTELPLALVTAISSKGSSRPSESAETLSSETTTAPELSDIEPAKTEPHTEIPITEDELSTKTSEISYTTSPESKPGTENMDIEQERVTTLPHMTSAYDKEINTVLPEDQKPQTEQHTDSTQTPINYDILPEKSTKTEATGATPTKGTTTETPDHVTEFTDLITESLVEIQTESLHEEAITNKPEKASATEITDIVQPDIETAVTTLSPEVSTTKYSEQPLHELHEVATEENIPNVITEKQLSTEKVEYVDTTPYSVELDEHTHRETEPKTPMSQESQEAVEDKHKPYTTEKASELELHDIVTTEELFEETTAHVLVQKITTETKEPDETFGTDITDTEKVAENVTPNTSDLLESYTTVSPALEIIQTEKTSPNVESTGEIEKDIVKITERPLGSSTEEPSIPEEELILVTTKFPTIKTDEQNPTQSPLETYTNPENDISEDKSTEIPEKKISEKPEVNATEKPQVSVVPEEQPTEKYTNIPEEKPTEASVETSTFIPELNATPEDKLAELPEVNPTKEPAESTSLIYEENPTVIPGENIIEIPKETPIISSKDEITKIPEEKPTTISEAEIGETPKEETTVKSEEEGIELLTEKPSVISEEKPLGEKSSETPEVKPTEISEENPSDTFEQNPTEKAEEKPGETSTNIPEEKPYEILDQPTTEISKEKPSEIPEETPTEAYEEQPTESPQQKPVEKPAENPSEIPEQKPSDVSEEKLVETHDEKLNEIPVEKSTEIPKEKPVEIPEDKPIEIPEEKPSEVLEEKPVEIADEKPSKVLDEKPVETPEEKPSEVLEEKPVESPEEKPSELPDEKPVESPEEKPSEIPAEKPSEIPDEKPVETPEEKPSEISEEKPSEILGEKPSEIPKEEPSEIPEEKPVATPDEIPEEKPSEIPEEKPSHVPEERPSEVPEQKPSETPEEDVGTGNYGQEPDYMEEDQVFGPGTCRYGGKVYVSAQQIPRDDPCDFCFCFRSDIICLQQSCPPPIHGCHEEPIQGFCCPRYECPVSMATTLNVTTTTTTTTTTLPPHFPTHAYKGAAQRKGCLIKGHTYKVGEVVRASSGPCLHCTCGGDGQMKCDPKACTPEPMLRQMIAAAVSSKRRR